MMDCTVANKLLSEDCSPETAREGLRYPVTVSFRWTGSTSRLLDVLLPGHIVVAEVRDDQSSSRSWHAGARPVD